MRSPAYNHWEGLMLEVDGIAVRYSNGALGVEDVSFRACPGALTLVSGANGAGKSTTLRAITGYLRSEGVQVVRGRISIDGREITNWEPYRISRIGVMLVPERRKVFANMSVRDNLTAIRGLPPRRLRSSKIQEIVDLFPDLGSRMGEMAGRLSGGQQQMLAIGRVLMGDASTIAIDEPTLGLHPSLHDSIYAKIHAIAAGGRTVIVADELASAGRKLADVSLTLKDGILLREDSVDDAYRR
jgi:branched-chain amino acid transport system ATP-binding protein